ncbi:hypothetical protein RRG08_011945 [Elysia crispata]|uniref:Protein kinase domain-containing protein n=1 Tax=Elysia crispata TaxID=231223 RepID=A0AAE0ZJE8_9GAST|nr:hypothetical protein RRG08_011945 [Elysia crispata]
MTLVDLEAASCGVGGPGFTHSPLKARVHSQPSVGQGSLTALCKPGFTHIPLKARIHSQPSVGQGSLTALCIRVHTQPSVSGRPGFTHNPLQVRVHTQPSVFGRPEFTHRPLSVNILGTRRVFGVSPGTNLARKSPHNATSHRSQRAGDRPSYMSGAGQGVVVNGGKAQSTGQGMTKAKHTYYNSEVVNDQLFYRFEILDVIGQGSFGQVVMCHDHKTDTEVAVKILKNRPR